MASREELSSMRREVKRLTEGMAHLDGDLEKEPEKLGNQWKCVGDR